MPGSESTRHEGSNLRHLTRGGNEATLFMGMDGILKRRLCTLYMKSKEGDPKRVGGHQTHAQVSKWERRIERGII